MPRNLRHSLHPRPAILFPLRPTLGHRDGPHNLNCQPLRKARNPPLLPPLIHGPFRCNTLPQSRSVMFNCPPLSLHRIGGASRAQASNVRVPPPQPQNLPNPRCRWTLGRYRLLFQTTSPRHHLPLTWRGVRVFIPLPRRILQLRREPPNLRLPRATARRNAKRGKILPKPSKLGYFPKYYLIASAQWRRIPPSQTIKS